MRNYAFPNPFLLPWKMNNSSYRLYRSLQCSSCCIGSEHSKNKWYILLLISWSTINIIDNRAFIACIYNAILLKKYLENMYFIVLISYLILKVFISLLRKVNNVQSGPFLKAIHSDYIIINVILEKKITLSIKIHLNSMQIWTFPQIKNTTKARDTLSTIINLVQ